MTVIRSLAAALALASLGLAPLAAQAQYDRPIGQPLGQAPWGEPVGGYPGVGSGELGRPGRPYGVPDGAAYGGAPRGQVGVCESHDGAYAECRLPFGGAPAIARTLSSTACVQGQTWGSRGPGLVWVAGGCRAEFVDAYGGQGGAWGGQGGGAWGGAVGGGALRCESDEGRQRECRASVATRYTLARQLSDAACVEGQSWGSDNRGRVWVRYGCRGEFTPARGRGLGDYGERPAVTCESIERRYNDCAWDPRWGRPYLAEQLSADACQEGRQWGYDGRGRLWVDRGCRGRFSAR